jgi:hypothetical protein
MPISRNSEAGVQEHENLSLGAEAEASNPYATCAEAPSRRNAQPAAHVELPPPVAAQRQSCSAQRESELLVAGKKLQEELLGVQQKRQELEQWAECMRTMTRDGYKQCNVEVAALQEQLANQASDMQTLADSDANASEAPSQLQSDTFHVHGRAALGRGPHFAPLPSPASATQHVAELAQAPPPVRSTKREATAPQAAAAVTQRQHLVHQQQTHGHSAADTSTQVTSEQQLTAAPGQRTAEQPFDAVAACSRSQQASTAEANQETRTCSLRYHGHASETELSDGAQHDNTAHTADLMAAQRGAETARQTVGGSRSATCSSITKGFSDTLDIQQHTCPPFPVKAEEADMSGRVTSLHDYASTGSGTGSSMSASKHRAVQGDSLGGTAANIRYRAAANSTST